MDKIKILVPTDFSACAHNALDYAIGLAGEIDAEIMLLHSIVYNDTTFISASSKEEENTKRYNDTKDSIDKELSYIKSKNPDLEVRSELDAENAELAIATLTEKEKIDYIIMGTEGASGLKAAIFGSFTNSVLLISSVPVFTIPGTATYKGIKYIVCTTEMDESEKSSIKEVIKLAEDKNALLVFYNVNSNEEEQRTKFSKFQKYIKTISDHPLIDYVIVESSDILESIEGYVCEKNPDLVITLGKERSFFDKMFGKKVTKQLCLHTSVPLLSFPIHYKTEKEAETSDLVKRGFK
jgi:nucleotide-binding universal stress UspA family protein